MTPGEFISKWGDTALRERASSQSHFIDLCRLLGWTSSSAQRASLSPALKPICARSGIGWPPSLRLS
jgi:hypothetical protein